MGKLSEKIAIVTGSGQGIGRAIAIAVASKGAAVVIAEKNPETCLRTAAEIRAFHFPVLSAVCDVSKRAQVENVVKLTIEEFGAVDILVNNAQTLVNHKPFEDTTDADMNLALSTGLMGTFYFMQACFPHLKKHGGKIINVASSAGTEGLPGFAAYGSAKEGIRALTRVAAREWGKYKINVNVICPFANSPFNVTWSEEHPKEYKALLARVPLQRRGDCEKDIAPAVVFLASSDSDYITGQTIMLDGGQFILR